MATDWEHIEDTLEEARNLATKIKYLQEDSVEPERIRTYFPKLQALIRVALADTEKALALLGEGDGDGSNDAH